MLQQGKRQHRSRERWKGTLRQLKQATWMSESTVEGRKAEEEKAEFVAGFDALPWQVRAHLHLA